LPLRRHSLPVNESASRDFSKTEGSRSTTIGASSSYAGKRFVEKNWLFVGHDDAGAVNATFTSPLASCRLCDVEPWSYLRDIFCLLSDWPEDRLPSLAPVDWKATRERDDVKRLLE
jgi:hypothetical protein